MSNEVKIEPAKPGRRRRYTAAQKRALLDEAARPGGTATETARCHGISPNLLFQWKRVTDDGTNKSLKANQRVVPESDLKKANAKIRELERMLGKKTMEVEILQEAVAIARGKNGSRAATRPAGTVDSDRDRQRAEDLATPSFEHALFEAQVSGPLPTR